MEGISKMEENNKIGKEGDTVKDVTLTILTQIETTQRLPTPRELGLSKRQLLRYIKKLKEGRLIKKIAYGVWEIIPLKEGDIKTHITPHLHNPIRGHGFKVTLTLPKITRWIKRETYLIKQAIPYRTIPQGQSITLQDFKIWLCDKSLVIHTTKGQDFYMDTAESSQQAFIQSLYNIFTKLESLFKISLRINKAYVFRIFRQHYGKVNDPLAIDITNKGQKLEVRNHNGTWLLVDKSLNLNELESVHQDTAVPDMDKVIVPFFNDLKSHYEKTGETLLFTDMMKSQALEIKQMAYVQKSLMDITRILEKIIK